MNSTVHENVIDRLLDKEDFQGVIHYCTENLNKGEPDCFLLQSRGSAYFEIEEYEFSITDFELGLSLFGDTNLYSNLGFSWWCLDDEDKAVECFSEYLKYHVCSVVSGCRAEIYFKQGCQDKAINDYESVFLDEINDGVLERLEEINQLVFLADTKEKIHVSVDGASVGFLAIGFVPAQCRDADKSYMFTLSGLGSSSGIYILEFSNGEYYVGQSVKLTARIKQHRRVHTDIINVYVKFVEENRLYDEETCTIAILERSLFRLRNLKQICFYNLSGAEQQKKWLDGTEKSVVSGFRFNNDVVRERFFDRYLIFKEKCFFHRAVHFLAKYIRTFIPSYIASEYNYWSISCLPKYLKNDKCISRININSVPVMSLYFNEEKNQLFFLLFTSRLPIYRHLKNEKKLLTAFDGMPSLIFELRNAFEASKGDEITFHVFENDFDALFESELMHQSIKTYNLRMMNAVGDNENTRPPPHCLDLADVLLSMGS